MINLTEICPALNSAFCGGGGPEESKDTSMFPVATKKYFKDKITGQKCDTTRKVLSQEMHIQNMRALAHSLFKSYEQG